MQPNLMRQVESLLTSVKPTRKNSVDIRLILAAKSGTYTIVLHAHEGYFYIVYPFHD